MIGVEPANAADAYRSFTTGKLCGHDSPPETVADGLRTTLGHLNWPVVQQLVDDIILVDEDEIVAAMRFIWERMKLVKSRVIVDYVLAQANELCIVCAGRGGKWCGCDCRRAFSQAPGGCPQCRRRLHRRQCRS